jgi:hypothetical protein
MLTSQDKKLKLLKYLRHDVTQLEKTIRILYASLGLYSDSRTQDMGGTCICISYEKRNTNKSKRKRRRRVKEIKIFFVLYLF